MPKTKKSDSSPSFLDGPQRLNKVLAAAGLGSRRQVEELIEQGRVEIDGKVCDEFHLKVDPTTTKISVDGVSLKKQKAVYFAVNKPAGILCTNRDPEGRPRVIDLVPPVARLFPVGRLDSSSLGLILLTNDGELTQRLAHPKYSVAKTYFVVVQGQIGYEELARLRRGIYLAEGVARVEGAKIRRVRKGCTEIDITLTEGKNREIRRVLARLGHKVVVLRRVAIGPLRLGDLPEGAYRPLQSSEVAALYRAAEEARLAKKMAKQKSEAGEGERDEELKDAKGKKKGAGRSADKNSQREPERSASNTVPSKKMKASKKRSTRNDLDDDELLVDRYDDEEGAIEDDDDFVPAGLDDSDSFESPDRSYDDPDGFDARNMVEVSPVWNDPSLPMGSTRGGVIDYEEEPIPETEEDDAARAERDENNKIIQKRPKGGVSLRASAKLKGANQRKGSEKGERPPRRNRPSGSGERGDRPSRRSSEGDSSNPRSESPKYMGKRSTSSVGRTRDQEKPRSSGEPRSSGVRRSPEGGEGSRSRKSRPNREGGSASHSSTGSRSPAKRSFKGKKGGGGSRPGGFSSGSSREMGGAKEGGSRPRSSGSRPAGPKSGGGKRSPKKGGSGRGSSGGKRGR